MLSAFMPDLETSIKEYEKAVNVKAWLVDTSARILFYVPIMGVWEKYVAGLENPELLKSRASAVAINLIFGRMHGKVREYVSKVTRTDETSSKKRKFLADSLSGFIIGITSYAPVLLVANVSLEEAVVAMPFAIALGAFSGRPYGAYHDWYRHLWKMTPVYKSTDQSSQ